MANEIPNLERPGLSHLRLPADVEALLRAAPEVTLAGSFDALARLSLGGEGADYFEVAYDLPGGKRVVEATVARVRNGYAVNYPEPYMRRRDPDCMVIADSKPTDKPRFEETFGQPFEAVRRETFDWLRAQPLIAFPFHAGRPGMGLDAVAVVPRNAAFFAYGLALLQGILDPEALPAGFLPRGMIFVAPPFRHTHFKGRQVVVHNRLDAFHEMFAYNLYPGPSAKKGVYSMLIGAGEKEGWITAHCSTVQVVTPYDNVITIMHEGASGGGKSEMLEAAHRQEDGRLLLGRNLATDEEFFLEIPRSCQLRPVTDDMALCHPSLQRSDGALRLTDAEDAWFIRVNHITEYGTDPFLEKLTTQPAEPLLFLNIDAVPRSRALIWEHIEDQPGKRCPNPRVIMPRKIVPGIVNEPVTVDLRSLGVRTPPCTPENTSYGTPGLFHPIPPALAWLWRLVAPRGYANPSIIHTEGISSEGVGSYWPFATGRRVRQANLMLDQILAASRVRYILCPNQHIGAWETGFMPQWIAREYLARRGLARFRPDQIRPARCPLLGYTMTSISVEGRLIPRHFLQVELQPEVGLEAYDAGAKILRDFFHEQARKFLEPDLMPLGRRIIEALLNDATLEQYENLIPFGAGPSAPITEPPRRM